VGNIYQIEYFFIVFRISHKYFYKNLLLMGESIGILSLYVKEILGTCKKHVRCPVL
jgi:hypothetical protein